MQVGVAMKSILDQLHCIALIYFPKLENSLESIDETIVELGKNLSHSFTCKATMIKVSPLLITFFNDWIKECWDQPIPPAKALIYINVLRTMPSPQALSFAQKDWDIFYLVILPLWLSNNSIRKTFNFGGKILLVELPFWGITFNLRLWVMVLTLAYLVINVPTN